MLVTDIRAVSELAHRHGALVAVDNTFASPYLQKPLDLGADVVFHSVTKFINGHADVVGGIIVAKDPELGKLLRTIMVTLGVNMDPHQAFLVSRGVKTLSLRVERAQENAMEIAPARGAPEVAWSVSLPSPSARPGEAPDVGFGSMISFELKGGYGRGGPDGPRAVATLASLGGVESLIEHPASMTHAGMPRADRLAAGITDGLVRYSVGIEDVNLVADLKPWP
jgi:methionine-gamma-lyase